jgi:hypothetical protein
MRKHDELFQVHRTTSSSSLGISLYRWMLG